MKKIGCCKLRPRLKLDLPSGRRMLCCGVFGRTCCTSISRAFALPISHFDRHIRDRDSPCRTLCLRDNCRASNV